MGDDLERLPRRPVWPFHQNVKRPEDTVSLQREAMLRLQKRSEAAKNRLGLEIGGDARAFERDSSANGGLSAKL
jgi:hypothetical protein